MRGLRALSYRCRMGIVIFNSVEEAIRAGYIIESPIPDSEGFLPSRIRTESGWQKALIRGRRVDNDR